jgi:signal-transduction protein with cAMP-binding, CBS, and nucleotidyltransferase domain
MKFEIEVDDETAIGIFVETLKEQYEDLKISTEKLSKLDHKTLQDYEKEDLRYNLKMLKNLKRVLEYNGIEV